MSEKLAQEHGYTIGRMGLKIPELESLIDAERSYNVKAIDRFFKKIYELNYISRTYNEYEFIIPAEHNKHQLIFRTCLSSTEVTHPEQARKHLLNHRLCIPPRENGEFTEIILEYNKNEKFDEDKSGSLYDTIINASFMGRSLRVGAHDSKLWSYNETLYIHNEQPLSVIQQRDIKQLFEHTAVKHALEETVQLLS